MRISNQTIYQNISSQLSNMTAELNHVQEQMSTGKQINKPSDDPIGATQAMRLKKVLSQIDQYGKNIQQGSSWLDVTNTSLNTISQLISQASDIASQMSTETGSASQRQAAAQSIQNILDQLVQIGNTPLNGRYIFSGYQDHAPAFTDNLTIHQALAAPANNPAYTGTATSSGAYTGLTGKQYVAEITTGGAVGVAQYRVSEDGGATWGPADAFTTSTSPTPVYNSTDLGVQIAFTNSGTLTAGDRFSIDVSRYQGDSGKMKVVTGNSSQVEVNLTGNEVFGETGNDLFDVLTGLENALETNDSGSIQASMSSLTQFQSNVAALQSEVGSRQDQIEVSQNILSNLDQQYTNQLSDVENADTTTLATLLQAKLTQYEAALYSANQILSTSFVDILK
ncbi:MAG TPA: flagellar hook-associated protein FlgL [Syntrophales bacterium]|nr:flagellar hook-associated protein FlgL [Syntrophales bacterium]